MLSRGRESHLSRSVEYWNQTKLKVVILHNTLEPLPADSFASNVRYIVMENDFASRCGRVSSEVNTKYAVMCADDELLLPSGLTTMGTYLDTHPDIASVGGKTLGVGKYGRNLTATYTYQNMANYFNYGETFFDRLDLHTFGQAEYRTGAMYRLMRSDVMRKMLQAFSELSPISTPYIFEVTGEIIVNGLGKTIYLEELYWVRNWINEQVEHRNWDRKLYFHQWWSKAEYANERDSWIDSLTTHVNEKESKIRIFQVVQDLNQKRKILEARELEAKSNLRNRIPKWPRKIKRFLTPRKYVKNNINHLQADLNGRDPKSGVEFSRALAFLH